jgi:hypothetical protein
MIYIDRNKHLKICAEFYPEQRYPELYVELVSILFQGCFSIYEFVPYRYNN